MQKYVIRNASDKYQHVKTRPVISIQTPKIFSKLWSTIFICLGQYCSFTILAAVSLEVDLCQRNSLSLAYCSLHQNYQLAKCLKVFRTGLAQKAVVERLTELYSFVLNANLVFPFWSILLQTDVFYWTHSMLNCILYLTFRLKCDFKHLNWNLPS